MTEADRAEFRAACVRVCELHARFWPDAARAVHRYDNPPRPDVCAAIGHCFTFPETKACARCGISADDDRGGAP